MPRCSRIPLSGDTLLVAPTAQIRDSARVISNIELIDAPGLKAVLAGRGTKTGSFWAANKRPERNGEGVQILIAKGGAIALWPQQATAHPPVTSLHAGHMPTVARLMHELYPKASLVVLTDIGSGQSEAEKATQLVGYRIAVPGHIDARRVFR